MNWIEDDPTDKTILYELQEYLRDEIEKQRRDPDPFRKTAPRDGLIMDGPLKLGTMPHHGFPYGIHIESLVRHLLVMGIIGGGKTTVIKNLLLQIFQLLDAPNVMILERKQEFTELAAVYPDINILDVEHLSFNPLLPPPGIKTEIWIGVLTECMINYLDILEASSSFLTDHALRLINLKKQTGEYPNLGDLLSFIAAIKYPATSKDGQQQQTVMNRLRNLRHNLPGIFSPKGHIGIEKFANNHCLLLLHEIPHLGIQNFVISLLLAQMFLHRKLKLGLQDELTNLIVIDEASSLFRRQDELRKEHASFISEVVKTARGYGIGLIAASQLSTDLSYSLLGNAGTRMMVGGFGRTADTDEFLKLRGYNQELRNHVIQHPIAGKAFIADSRWPHIVECNMAQPQLPPKLEMPVLTQRITESFNRLSTPLDKPAALLELTPQKTAQPTPLPAPETIPLDIRTLNSIYDSNFMKLADRAKQLGIPSSTLKKAIETLEDSGYIKIYKVHCNRSGAPRDLYKITSDGYQLIGKPKQKMKGKGDYLHQFYQRHVARHFKTNGYRADIEGTAHSKDIDIIARKQPSGECVAVEIELNGKANPDHVIENLERAAEVDFIDRILCLVPTEPERKHIKKCVTTSGLEKKKPILVERIWKHMEA